MRFRDGEITQDDHEHPSPFIRPDVYVDVLEQLEGTPSKITEAILSNWKNKIDARLTNQNDKHEREGILAELQPKVKDLYELYMANGIGNTKLVKAPATLPSPGTNIDDLTKNGAIGFRIPATKANMPATQLLQRFCYRTRLEGVASQPI